MKNDNSYDIPILLYTYKSVLIVQTFNIKTYKAIILKVKDIHQLSTTDSLNCPMIFLNKNFPQYR